MLGFAVRVVRSARNFGPFLDRLIQDYIDGAWYYHVSDIADADDYYWLYVFGSVRIMSEMRRDIERTYGNCNMGPVELNDFNNPNVVPRSVWRFYWFRLVATQSQLRCFNLVRSRQRWQVPRIYYTPGARATSYWRRIESATNYPLPEFSPIARRMLRSIYYRAFNWGMRPYVQMNEDGEYTFPELTFSE